MSKILIFADTIDTYICSQSNTLTMDATKILTPGARDALSARKVQIIYEPQSTDTQMQSCAPAATYAHQVASKSTMSPNSKDFTNSTAPCHMCATFADIFGEEQKTGQGPCFASSISKEFGWDICTGAHCKKSKK